MTCWQSAHVWDWRGETARNCYVCEVEKTAMTDELADDEFDDDFDNSDSGNVRFERIAPGQYLVAGFPDDIYHLLHHSFVGIVRMRPPSPDVRTPPVRHWCRERHR